MLKSAEGGWIPTGRYVAMSDHTPEKRTSGPPAASPSVASALGRSRRILFVESLGIMVSSAGFGFVYGLAAREHGLTLFEASATSLMVFAGAAQFAALGYVASGIAWPGIFLLTALLNARHILYSVAIAPWLSDRPLGERAAMAHFLTDESFALSLAHFRRLGHADRTGYWFAVLAATVLPWMAASMLGVAVGGSIPDPSGFGIDVIFPAAMVGLAVLMVSSPADIAAGIGGSIVAVAIALAGGTAIGILAGGLIGPLIGLFVQSRSGEASDRPERLEVGVP